MKEFVILTRLFVLWFYIMAQAPQKMSYQAVVRNSAGNLVINHAVGMRVTILLGSANRKMVYQESYSPVPITNANGLVSIEVGTGIPVTGTFSGINWSSGIFYLRTETDPSGGTNYIISGTSQLLSVPYAMYAITAERAIDAALKSYVDEMIDQLLQNFMDTGIHWPGSDKNIEGNKFGVYYIDNQYWMDHNLRTGLFNDWTSIPLVIDPTRWSELTTPAYC